MSISSSEVAVALGPQPTPSSRVLCAVADPQAATAQQQVYWDRTPLSSIYSACRDYRSEVIPEGKAVAAFFQPTPLSSLHQSHERLESVLNRIR